MVFSVEADPFHRNAVSPSTGLRYYWLRVFRPLVFARKTLKSRHLCLTT
jgi:hypothetical protein